ncbi:MAG TPA: hypothetical protein VM324_04690 [Egibacteraceae bacterium]|nr:hypothetical protein [Egibacteraceae bacterium]
MGAAASLSRPTLTVDPGGEATAELTVRNVGTVVDQFTFEVHGEGREWLSVEPPSISLLPAGEGTVTLRAAPPRAPTVAAGTVPFGVRVVSSEDPPGSVVEEGTLEIGAYTDLSAELLPRTSRARRSSAHEVAVDNRGNRRVNATLAALDPDELLGFRVDPPGFVAEPGTASFAKVQVAPLRRFWRGQPKTHPFQVLVQPDDDEPIALDGTVLQEAVLPAWLPKALLAALLVALALLALWLVVFRSVVENAAREAAEEAAEEALAEQTAAVEKALADAAAAQTAADEAAAAADSVANDPEGAVASAAEEAAERAIAARGDLGDPFDFRLPGSARTVAAGATDTEVFEVPEGQTLSLTDIVLQNPGGDRGLMRVQRGEEAVLIEVRMENFRDLDYHFVSPVVFTSGQQVVLSLSCENEGGQTCNGGAYFNGFSKSSAPPAGEQPE